MSSLPEEVASTSYEENIMQQPEVFEYKSKDPDIDTFHQKERIDPHMQIMSVGHNYITAKIVPGFHDPRRIPSLKPGTKMKINIGVKQTVVDKEGKKIEKTHKVPVHCKVKTRGRHKILLERIEEDA